MTVEASLVLPLFLFFIFNVLFLIDVIRLQSSVTAALQQTGDKICEYAWYREYVSDGDQGGIQIPQAAGDILSLAYVSGEMRGYLGSGYMNSTCLPLAANEDTPAKIVKSMNDSLVEMNDKCMFVTFFCAVLDLVNGRLRYCNAGHNPPMILADKATKLPVVSNLPLGILPGFKYAGQEAGLRADDAIFLYTDGLTEAENRAKEQFGEARVEDALRGSMGSEEHLAQVRKRVEAFVGKAPQSDDLTMLVIRYLGTEKGNHLTLANDIKQISLLSGFIDRVAEENDLDPGLAMSLNLAIEEAVTNVIMYAYPEGTEGKIDLQASTEGRCLQFILSDSGKSFDPTAVPDADISASLQERHIGGLGIHLVRNIMDSVSYRRNNGKNILTMTKNI